MINLATEKGNKSLLSFTICHITRNLRRANNSVLFILDRGYGEGNINQTSVFADAATLYALVKQEGVFNTRVRLTGDIPKSDSMEDTVARQNDDFQRVRQARGYYDDSRSYYYYRPQPYYERRYYNGRGFFPFGW